MNYIKRIFTAEVAIGLGILILVAGLGSQPVNISYSIAGLVTIVGALACKSARNRANASVKQTITRKVIELLAIIACAFLFFMQNDLKTLIVEDPVPNFIIPVWVFVAYLLAAKKV